MILIAILGTIFGLLWCLKEFVSRKKCPPGPLVLPIIGNICQVAWASHLPGVAFAKLSKKYGNIMSLKVGKIETIVISDYKNIQELLNRKELQDRSFDMEVIRERNMHKNLGIIFSNGSTWAEIRKFTLKCLREFGFGKTSSMEMLTGKEIDDFIIHIQKKMQNKSNIITVDGLFAMSMLNIIWSYATGVRFEHDDPKLNTLVEVSSTYLKSTNFAASISTAFPFVRKYFPELSGRYIQVNAVDDMHNFLREIINDRKNRDCRKSQPGSFVDIFLNQIEAEKDNPDTNFTDDQLVLVLLDLFQAGGDTAAELLSFAIFYLVLYPEVQKKVQQEVDRIVPPGTTPTLSQKESMVYTQATIFEICRLGIVVPIPPARKVNKDFYYKNYLFKKGMDVMYNLYSVCRAETDEPDNFRPERFITGEGNLDTKMFDRMCIFGYGKRMCIGNTLAMNAIFLFITSVLQRMSFRQVPGKPIVFTEPRLGITMSPHPFDVIVEMRAMK